MTIHDPVYPGCTSIKSAIEVIELQAKAIDKLREFIDSSFVEVVSVLKAMKGHLVVIGIGKSAIIGKNCTIGGGAGIQGHIEICDNVQITGMTKVSCNIKEAGTYSSGTPIMSNKTWLKNAARFKQLNNLFIKYKKNIDKN